MVVFIDLEASSLGRLGYPIEVGWAVVDHDAIATVESHLIKPSVTWLDEWEWSEASAKVHGLTPEELDHKGESIDVVCRRLVDLFAGRTVYTDAPSADGRWLAALFGAWIGNDSFVPVDQLPMTIKHAFHVLGPPAVSMDATIYSENQLIDVPIVHRAGADARRLAKQYVIARQFDADRRMLMRGNSMP